MSRPAETNGRKFIPAWLWEARQRSMAEETGPLVVRKDGGFVRSYGKDQTVLVLNLGEALQASLRVAP
jgi:hypothetical protein